MNSKILNRIKAFGMTNQMVIDDLSRVAERYSINLGHLPTNTIPVEDTYFPQFDSDIRSDAATMSKHYEAIYCLENSIRTLISSTLSTSDESIDWWKAEMIPPAIIAEVNNRIEKELGEGISRRSTDPLAYTTFGELSSIILFKWDTFGGMFNSKTGFVKIMAKLNSLRATIAHCCPLAEDEELRLQISIRDWFRLME